MATGKPPLAHMDKMAALIYIGAQRGLMPSLPDRFSENAKDFVKISLTRWDLESSWVIANSNILFIHSHTLWSIPDLIRMKKTNISLKLRCHSVDTFITIKPLNLFLKIHFVSIQWPETASVCRPVTEACIHPTMWEWNELLENTEKELLWSPRGIVWLERSDTKNIYDFKRTFNDLIYICYSKSSYVTLKGPATLVMQQ